MIENKRRGLMNPLEKELIFSEVSMTAETVFTGRLPLRVGIIELAMPENQSNAKTRGASARRKREGRRRGKRRTERVDVQTELDTIRKSILRRWYAVKIILVSAVTRRAHRSGWWARGGWDGVCGTEPDPRHKDSSFWHKSKPLVCVHMARTGSHCPRCPITTPFARARPPPFISRCLA